MRDIFEYRDCFADYAHVKSQLLWGNLQSIPYPKVSILMPVYRNSKFFREALQSALNQDFEEPYEVIVCDNTPLSPEPTDFQHITEELNNPKVLYFRNKENIGMFPNWNRCIELARAPHLTFCHDDDMLFPNALTLLMQFHKSHGNRAIFPRWFYINEESEPLSSYEEYKPKKWLGLFIKYPEIKVPLAFYLTSGPGMGGGALFFRNHLMELGGFNASYYPCSDFHLFARYTEKFGCVITKSLTYQYRQSNNASLNCWKEFAPILLQIRRSIANHLHIPKFIANYFLMVIYRTNRVAHARQWCPSALVHCVKERHYDQKIKSIILHLTLFPHYRFHF